MDIIKAATFITDEDRWVEKLAIGVGVILVSSVLSVILIGFLGFFIVAGYIVRLLQNVRDGKDQVLPEWNEWSADLRRGFKLFVVMMVWSLAIWIFMVPLAIGGVMSDSGSGFVQFIGMMLTLTASCFMMLYGIFILLAQPAVSIAFAADEQIRSGLALSKVWHWTRANLGQVIIAAIAVVVASFIIGAAGMLVGTLLCIIGLAITVPLATLITYIYQFHLYGQLANAHPFDGRSPVAPETSDDDGDGDAGEVAGLLDTEVVETTEETVDETTAEVAAIAPSVDVEVIEDGDDAIVDAASQVEAPDADDPGTGQPDA